MKYNKGTIITIDNIDKYIIYKKIIYNDTNYYCVTGYDEEKQDINGICKIIKIISKGINDSIELVNNKAELAKVIPLFSKVDNK